jgi:hypothetical protein
MQGEHATTVTALINWFRREDDIGKITFDNYECLASLANRWDIPMLLHDIDVLPITSESEASFSFVFRQNRQLIYGFSHTGTTYHVFESVV